MLESFEWQNEKGDRIDDNEAQTQIILYRQEFIFLTIIQDGSR